MTRRDRWGRYLVVPPGGGKPVGYTRVTTVAKALDDGAGLLDWKATAAVVGTMRRAGLRAQWEQLLADHAEPWYSTPDSKRECKRLVGECAEAGGSADRAQLGTALHALVETLNKGGTPLVSQASTQADLDAYQRAVESAGLLIDPDMCERTVVLDGVNVAGMSDLLAVKVPNVGTVVADLKTGANLDYGWQSIAVQLAAYAHADSVYVQGDAEDGSDDVRLPMPDISREVGLVIHLPAGEARCTLHLVDLTAGWQAFQRSIEVRQWRTRKDLARPLVAVEAALKAKAKRKVLEDATPVVVEDDFDAPKVKPITTAAPREQRAELRKRPEEGDTVTQAQADVLKAHFDAMDAMARDQFKVYVEDARRGGVEFHLSALRSVRRFEIARALIRLCSAATDAEVIRALAAAAMGTDAPLFPSVTVGHGVGALDVTEAALFARLTDAYLSDAGLPATVDEHGVLRFDVAA